MNSQAAWGPRIVAVSGQRAGGNHSTPGSHRATHGALSRRLNASKDWRRTSPFSRDIRLLPRPYGFECFGLTAAVAPPNDSLVTPLGEYPAHLLDHGRARFPCRAPHAR